MVNVPYSDALSILLLVNDNQALLRLVFTHSYSQLIKDKQIIQITDVNDYKKWESGIVQIHQ